MFDVNDCPFCDGTGSIRVTDTTSTNMVPIETTCTFCNGTGKHPGIEALERRIAEIERQQFTESDFGRVLNDILIKASKGNR